MLIPSILNGDFDTFKRNVNLLEVEEDIVHHLLVLPKMHWDTFIDFAGRLHKTLNLLCLMLTSEDKQATEQLMVSLFLEKKYSTYDIDTFNQEYCLPYLLPHLNTKTPVRQKWRDLLHKEFDDSWSSSYKDPYMLAVRINNAGVITLFEEWFFHQPNHTWDKKTLETGLDFAGINVMDCPRLSLWLGVRAPQTEQEKMWNQWMLMGLYQEAASLSLEETYDTMPLEELRIHV